MENRLLKYFLVVAQEENITRAAEILHVSQPALSKQMMQLENELGATLFIRGKRSLTLTEEGRFLRGRAREIVALTEKTERDFKDGIVSYNGIIAIGMGETSASHRLGELAVEFSKSYPDVKFDFYSATADSVKERIEKGVLDAGLIIEPAIDLAKCDFPKKSGGVCLFLRKIRFFGKNPYQRVTSSESGFSCRSASEINSRRYSAYRFTARMFSARTICSAMLPLWCARMQARR